MVETDATVTEGPGVAMMQAWRRARRRLLVSLTEQAIAKMIVMNITTKKAAIVPPIMAPTFTAARGEEG